MILVTCCLFRLHWRIPAVAPSFLAVTAGCAAMTRVTNLSDESCRSSIARQLSAILMSEGETQEVADKVLEIIGGIWARMGIANIVFCMYGVSSSE